MMGYRVLIFGGTGFIGQKVVDALKKETNIVIKIATRQEALVREQDNYVHFDMNRREGLIDQIKNEIVQSDVIINMAGEINEDGLMWKVNHDAPKTIFEIYRSSPKQKKTWIQLSSCGVFDVKFNRDITVESQKTGRNNYEKSKLAFDDYLRGNVDDTINACLLYPSVVISEPDARIQRLYQMLGLRIIRCALSPQWTLNVVKLDYVVDAIIETVESNLKRDGDPQIAPLSELVLNQPALIRDFSRKSGWLNVSYLSQRAVSLSFKLGILNRKLHERLLFLFSNVRYK